MRGDPLSLSGNHPGEEIPNRSKVVPANVKQEAHSRHIACFISPCSAATAAASTITGRIVVGGYMDKDLNQRGTENEIKGKAKEMKGNLRGDVGDATDNTSEHIKGRVEQAKGKFQKNFGKAERKLDPDNI